MPSFNFDQSAALTASSVITGAYAAAAWARPKDVHDQLFTSPARDDEVMRHMGMATAGWTAMTAMAAAMEGGDQPFKKNMCAVAGAGLAACCAQVSYGTHKGKLDKKLGTMAAVNNAVLATALLAKGLEGRFNK